MNHPKKQSTNPNPQKQKQNHFNLSQAISILQRKHYGCLSKVFCCKCFYCCQDFDFTLMTSKNRKGAFQQMVKKYLKSMHTSTQTKTNIIMDPFFILVALLLGQQSQIYNQLLQEVSNANQTTIFSKQDLEFYIPQLCTYLVFHQQMSNAQLSTFLQRACKVDLHFSLRYYFFMKSLEIIDSTYQIKKLPIVEKYNSEFRNKINLCHKSKAMVKDRKKSLQDSRSEFSSLSQTQKDVQHDITVNKLKSAIIDKQENFSQNNPRSKIFRKASFSSQCYSQSNDQDFDQNQNQLQMCKTYNTNGKSFSMIQKPIMLDINQIYTPCILKSTQHYPLGLFESTANFFYDLVQLSEVLLKIDQQRGKLFEKQLDQMNAKLPALVYVPLTKSINFKQKNR